MHLPRVICSHSINDSKHNVVTFYGILTRMLVKPFIIYQVTFIKRIKHELIINRYEKRQTSNVKTSNAKTSNELWNMFRL